VPRYESTPLVGRISEKTILYRDDHPIITDQTLLGTITKWQYNPSQQYAVAEVEFRTDYEKLGQLIHPVQDFLSHSDAIYVPVVLFRYVLVLLSVRGNWYVPDGHVGYILGDIFGPHLEQIYHRNKKQKMQD
jgi:hypothetical protein